MNLIKKTSKQTIIVLIPLSIISAFIEWKRLPISILLGGLIGLLNLKGLAKGVESLVVTYQQAPKGRLIFGSVTRLFILACVLGILFYLNLINPFGILIGFTVFFIIFVKESLKAAREL
ncbi:MAG: hypothetical protein FJ242_09260 [Nitrospira sp.]|nr:hypothetical protein [Nitrospira sp.]